MPGFTLIYQQHGLDKGIKDRTERLVRSSFKVQYITKTEELIILFRDGNHYPYEIFETNNYILILEGVFYGLDPMNDKNFQAKVERLFTEEEIGSNSDESPVLNYFRDLDGEFILYLIAKRGDKIMVLNDFLGRLPTYYRRGNQLFISRDIFVLDKISTGLYFDDSSVYQFMRIGFPMGSRTLYHDVDRLEPSSLVSINSGNIKISHKALNVFEWQDNQVIEDPAGDLYDCFQQAMKDRFEKEGNFVISLSGGLDSRVIMGEAEKQKYPVNYASFYYQNLIIEKDLDVAKKLGRHYNRSPQVFELKEYSPETFDELTLAKGGMNYLGMAFLIRYLMELGHGFTFMLTGDGGDKTLPYLFLPGKMKAKKIGKYLLRNHQVSTKKTLDSFLLLDIQAEEERLREYLDNLPGNDSDEKYKNFLLWERTKNWLIEGEDRNRSYLWSTSPFYQPAFFKLAHSLPEAMKKNFSLFRSFTDLVDPKLNDIENANWHIPLGDKKRVDTMFMKQRIKSYLPGSLFKQTAHLAEHRDMAGLVAALMHKGFGGQLGVYADQHDLNAASSETLFHLITLLKVSEMTWRDV
jgi:asparagine synthase (glutamine-hydrolysing)